MILQICLKNYSKNQFKKQFAIACTILSITFQSIALTAYANAKNRTAATGRFISAEHPTTGQARIIQEGTKRFLIFNKAFRTLAGPDLFVVLHRAAIPKTYPQKDYVLLGKLKNTAGEQRYEIPDKVDSNAFQSVVIWCRQFSATFGYAKLPR
jgi:Electron transfer DM13